MNDIRRLIETGVAKQHIHQIEKMVTERSENLSCLMSCFFDDESRINQHSAGIMELLAKHNQELLHPYVEEMLQNIEQPKHNSIERNTFRTFQFMDFPENVEGKVFDKAMEVLSDIKKQIAIRVFAMTVATNITMKYPELVGELIPVIEEHLPHGSTGFKNRGNKLLAKLYRIKT